MAGEDLRFCAQPLAEPLEGVVHHRRRGLEERAAATAEERVAREGDRRDARVGARGHLEDGRAERVAGHVVRAHGEAADVPLLQVGDAARDAGEG